MIFAENAFLFAQFLLYLSLIHIFPLTASLEQADRFVLQNAQWIRDTRVKNITKLIKDCLLYTSRCV